MTGARKRFAIVDRTRVDCELPLTPQQITVLHVFYADLRGNHDDFTELREAERHDKSESAGSQEGQDSRCPAGNFDQWSPCTGDRVPRWRRRSIRPRRTAG